MKFFPGVFVLLISVFNLFAQSETYQWRGENRKGIFSEKNLLKEWPENGPEELWYIDEIGNGYGSPTVTETNIFITGEIDSICWLFNFDMNGKLLWKQNLGKEWTRSFPGSRSAPTVTGHHVYVATGMGNLFCVNCSDGAIVWSKDFRKDASGNYPLHGFSEAPVIYDGKLFWTPGGKEDNVVALNRYTGEIIWKCKGFGDRSGYNPGNLIVLLDRTIFVTFTAYHLLGIDAETGIMLWSQLQDNTPVEKREPGIGDTNSNNVIFEDGFIYYAAGDGNCGVKLKLSEYGNSIEEIWRNPDFDSFMRGFVKTGDYLYGCGTAKKYLKSINTNTGEIKSSAKYGSGAIIFADNMIYYYNQRGELMLFSLSDGTLELKSTFKIMRGTKEHFSQPVIKNGILYQRHGKTLMAFDIKNRQL